MHRCIFFNYTHLPIVWQSFTVENGESTKKYSSALRNIHKNPNKMLIDFFLISSVIDI